MKVLIVDDNPSFLELFELYAEDYIQFDFIYGKSVKEALKILESETNKDISLIITDVRMPNISGIDFSRIIQRKTPKNFYHDNDGVRIKFIFSRRVKFSY